MSLDWLDGPFALRLRGLTSPVVTVRFGYFTGPSTHDEKHGEVVLIPKTQIRPFLSFVKELQKPDGQPRLRTAWDEPQTLTPLSWEDLILDDNITNVLRSDFDAFFKREAWFKSMRLPFRRGYLLHGPPGNGKSSAVRAMLTSRGMTAHTLRLFQDNTDDGALDRLFNLAAQNAPAMILLEDIDRAFPRTGARTKISLQNLLNRLDGVASGDGLVVVATANEPTALDPAILKRPGRFDRVVLFPNPKPELRRRYFKHLNPEMGSENLDFVVSTSDGFSFAQLREAYIMAGQIAFTENREVLMSDLIWAVHTLRRSTLTSSLRGKVAGFTSDKEALPSA
jgi:SpoVK/Ycf46/Vps4 family AAA+-type ATPase